MSDFYRHALVNAMFSTPASHKTSLMNRAKLSETLLRTPLLSAIRMIHPFHWWNIYFCLLICLFSCSQGKQKLQHNSLYDSVETFVLFVGYPRSGHSLIGAILDSHPEIVIPHEFHLLANFNNFYKDPNEESYSRRLRIFSALHSRSYNQSIDGSRSPNYRQGYSYYIPGSWQGKYGNQIKVKV